MRDLWHSSDDCCPSARYLCFVWPGSHDGGISGGFARACSWLSAASCRVMQYGRRSFSRRPPCQRRRFMTTLRVFTFAPDWGLPTVGPFALKLLAWLELARIPYEQVIEANPRKGPKGKNPWIELEGERI